ncbi:DUF6185 family protein [Streptomyces shenzhenensis]|uniref:DUF6185 family protein n=1 Tax=Streptomyces shenzhenensis TaxID=943815 RepID=UPI0015F1089D|nr:DUF6185 family protein [Streptomyces shenzhenensis]
MRGTQWCGRILLLSLVLAAVWGYRPPQARADTPENCSTQKLDGSRVTAHLQFDEHGHSYVKVTSDMTIEVNRKWELAEDLMSPEESTKYQHAMRCLLLGGKKSASPNEWRPHDPVVTKENEKMNVQYISYTFINLDKSVRVGPWVISKPGRSPHVYLKPETFEDTLWNEITVNFGGLHFHDLSGKASSVGTDKLVWEDKSPSSVQFEVDLPWQRALQLSLNKSVWRSAGIIAWWVCGSAVLALAALRARRPRQAMEERVPPAAQAPSLKTWSPPGDSPTRTLLEWALLSAAIAVALSLFVSHSLSTRWRALVCIPAGLALVLVARPWTRRSQARAVIAGVSGVAAIGLLVVFAHDLFGLPEGLKTQAASPFGRFGLILLAMATVWLWLAAMAAWAWRFGREGGLLRAGWVTTWNTSPGRCATAVGVLLAAASGALLMCMWYAMKRQQKRTAWLAGQPGSAGSIDEKLADFSNTALTWMFAYSWVLTGIALVALLRFRTHGRRTQSYQESFAIWPADADLLLTVSLFAFFVGLRAAIFAGFNMLYSVWLLLTMYSLYVAVTIGRRHSTLSLMGEEFRDRRLDTEKHRKDLMRKAHRYRDLNHRIYLLDQGRGGTATGEELENQLHRLRQWLVSGCGRHQPPEKISVLDVALALGPEWRWWDNAARAAIPAFWFGLPASCALSYYTVQNTSFRETKLLFEPTGIPDAVAQFLLYQLAWAAAGFTLGALWRLLPGRRGPARAWSLAAGYSIPVLLAVLIIRITDTDPGQLLLYALFLLTILTLTGIWTDMATFQGEQELWPSRMALLLSIYQMRGLSTQIAWLLVQVVAVVGIWHQLTHA